MNGTHKPFEKLANRINERTHNLEWSVVENLVHQLGQQCLCGAISCLEASATLPRSSYVWKETVK